MVLDLSDSKRVDVELLEKIMLAIEDRASIPEDKSCNGVDKPHTRSLEASGSPEGKERSRETEFLVNMIGNVLQLVCFIFFHCNFNRFFCRIIKHRAGLAC